MLLPATKLIAVLVTSLLLISCADSPRDFADKYHHKSKNIIAFAKGQRPNVEYWGISEISATVCRSDENTNILKFDKQAVEILKLKAAKLNANAVFDYQCETRFVDVLNNCTLSRECSGFAVRLDAKDIVLVKQGR